MIKWLQKYIVVAAVRNFEDIFKGVPCGKPCSLWFEIGEFDEQTGDYQLDGQAPLYVAPDGSIWARVCNSVSELPAIEEC